MAIKAKLTDWKPEESFGGLLILLGTNFYKIIKRDFASRGLENFSFPRLLVLLSLKEGEKTQVQLSRILNQKEASMSELLIRMDAEKLISWRKDRNDLRKKAWRLTPKGENYADQSKKYASSMGGWLDRVFKEENIPKHQIQETKKLLKTIYNAFSQGGSEK